MEAHPRATHAQLAAILGWTEGNLRSRLTEARGKLGADVGDDLVKLARERGMLAGRTAGSAAL